MKITRFQDDGRYLSRFTYLMLVVCPRCEKCAHVMPRDAEKSGYWDAHRVTCLHC
jgi:hypothetical protein